MATWSYAYLRDCLTTLAAPGIPVRYAYKTPGGDLTFLADSYAADLETGTLQVSRPRVIDPDGRQILNVSSIQVQGLRTLFGQDRSVRVTVNRLSGRLVRLPDGKLDLQRYIRPREGEPSTVPFEVVVRGAYLELLDLAGKTPFRQRIETKSVRVAGLGDDWIAGTRIVAPGIGRADLNLQSVADSGVHVTAIARRLELARVLEHLSTTAPLNKTEVAKLHADSLQVIGPVRVFVPKDTTVRLESRLELQAKNVRYGEYFAPTASFAGFLREGGAQGVVDATVTGATANFRGALTWTAKKLAAAGAVDVRAVAAERLPIWVRRQIPAKVGFQDARFAGWVAFNSATDYRLSGTARAARATYGNEIAREPDVDVRVRPNVVALNVRSVAVADTPLHGVVTLNTKTKTVEGAVRVDRIVIGPLATRFGQRDLSGTASASAIIEGPLSKPAVTVLAQGDAKLRRDGRLLSLGKFEADGRWEGDRLTLRRGVVRGPLGLLAANGAIGTGKEQLGIGVVGRDINPSPLFPELKGRANLVAQVGGSVTRPTIKGYAEAYNIRYGEYVIPALRTDLFANSERAELLAIRGTSGTAEVTGDASLRFKEGGLKGQLRASRLQIADLAPGKPDVVGLIDVPKLTVGGTLKDPRVSATAHGENLVFRGTKLDTVDATLHANLREVVLDSSKVTAGGGSVSADGRYGIRAKAGRINAIAERVALSPLAQQISDQVTLGGRVSGRATAAFNSKGLLSLEGAGDLTRIALNGTAMGDGSWAVAKSGSALVGDLRVGSLERYIELEKVSFDPDTKALKGTAYLHNALVQDFVAIGDRYLADASADTKQNLRDLKGVINLGAKFEGTTDAPQLTLESFEASNLEVGGLNVGTLTAANIELKDRKWQIPPVELNGELGIASVQGSIEEEGDIRLNGEVQGVEFAKFGQLFPAATASGGKLRDLSFIVRGPTKNPRIRASANVQGLFANPALADSGLDIGLGEIRLGREDGLQIDGVVSYRGFEGTLTARAPFDFPFRIPSEGRILAKLSLADRDLNAVAPYLGALDPARTKGSLGGELVAEGTADSLDFRGELHIDSERVAFKLPDGLPIGTTKPEPLEIADSLEAFRAALKFEKGEVRFDLKGNSSRGGAIVVNASTPLGQFGRLASTLRDEGARGLLQSDLSGKIAFQDFNIRQGLPKGSYVGGTLDGEILLGGKLNQPAFSTTSPLKIRGVDTVLPTLEPGTGESRPPAINPTFDVAFRFSDPARIRTTAAELFVLGTGKIGGSLALPDVRAGLEVDHGTLTLPGGRVRLEQGGTVDVQFAASPRETVARADVDLEGHTAITALRFGDTYERYEITLGVRGNLLEDGGLNLSASSDPPDLTRDRILALLGQTDLLEALGSNPRSANTEKQIRNALTSYALPSLADPITNRIAQGLGLDYLSVEYNPLAETSVALAKSIGSGFFIQGRRQISEPPPGFVAQYDLRLVYRPRRVRGALSRVSFSIGADEQRPIKLAVEYSVRF